MKLYSILESTLKITILTVYEMPTMCQRHLTHLLQFLQEPDEAGNTISPLSGEDTEALQPKP